MVEAGRQAKKIGLAEFSAALLLGVREPLGRDSVATGIVLVADSWKCLLSRLPMIPAGSERALLIMSNNEPVRFSET